MRSIWLSIALLVGLTAVAAADKQTRYVGIHPIPKAQGGGTCYIEGPHIHLYGADKVQYRDHGGANYFVGDPVAYGYDGPKYVYKGHHPIHVDVVVGDGMEDTEWCYIDGPHYHYFQPPEGPDFKVVGDVYFYVADPPKVYVEARPAYIGINAMYRPMVYARPVVTVEAPVGWIGLTVVAPAVVVAPPPPPRAVVVAPGVHIGAEVHVPMPSISVGVGISGGVGVHGGGGVIVKERPHKARGR
jgi:hypothetical protein